MPGSPTPRGSRTNQLLLARVIYAVLLAVTATGLSETPIALLRGHVLEISVLIGVAVCNQLASHHLRARRLAQHFDMATALVLVAVVLGGPVAGAVVAVVPELLFIVRRREAGWRLWAVANWTSIATEVLCCFWVLHTLTGAGVPVSVGVFLAGVAMLLTNYLVARLILAVAREGVHPWTLIRSELLGAWRPELAAIAIGVASAVLIPHVGVLALLGFPALVYLPQLVAAQLLNAPSVAALSVDDAARVYRDALADEAGLPGNERRYLHTIDALAQRRPLDGAPANPLAAAHDALIVTICTQRPPAQPAFTAPVRAQIVLVARAWAQLTARCTPALSHREAMHELRRSGLSRDAPLALICASRIIAREHALTDHVAGVPRLHRVPLPRAVRQAVLSPLLARLTA